MKLVAAWRVKERVSWLKLEALEPAEQVSWTRTRKLVGQTLQEERKV